MTMVPTMPFLFRSVDHMRKSLDGPVGAEILKSCESVGYVGLAFYDSGARSIYAKKAIKSVADAKGLKTRPMLVHPLQQQCCQLVTRTLSRHHANAQRLRVH
jgi:TRAP-type C4-dicarboxylate transport system substrate-binding protein